MTEAEIKRRKAICEVAGVKEIDDVSEKEEREGLKWLL